MTDGQRSDIITTMIGVIPSLSFDEAQMIIGKKGPFIDGIRSVFKKALQPQQLFFATPPPDGQDFELTMNEEVDPEAMIKNEVFQPTCWKFLGTLVTAPQTRRFQLIRVKTFSHDCHEIQTELLKLGFLIPEGQWRESFKKTFPRNDGLGPIGFADLSWEDNDRIFHFPMLDGNGASWHSKFGSFHIRYDNLGTWRWLIEKK
jgi:hypothetical protein